MASNISNNPLAERNTMIGSRTSHLKTFHVQPRAESDHQPPYCNVETSRPLGAARAQWRLGLPEDAFPLSGEHDHPAHVDLVWRLYGEVLARPSILTVNHHSERGDEHSLCQLINRTVETPPLTAALRGRYFTMVAVELDQGMQTRCVPVSR
jgi:hypothetical protein